MLLSFSIGTLLVLSIVILIRQLTTVVVMWKINGITILPHVVVLFLLILLSSCSKEEMNPDVCVSGDCNTSFRTDYPIDENGYYNVTLDYDGEYYPRFFIDVFANSTNKHWWYNDMPVVEAEFYGDKYLKLPYEEVPVVQESQIYLTGKGEILSSRRIVGPIPPQMKGDTLNVRVEVFWDAGENSVLKQYSLKFILN